ncbi:MAG: chorismate synthase [Candidatus Omnitrophica bacterium]|nr:chorismate synthase [Candidatus Omnitrophota bacterium]
MLRYLTAGESHGSSLVGILEGMPAGIAVNTGLIDKELARRQQGYGRSARMKIESDKVAILSGVRSAVTTGGPIALQIINKDSSIDTLPKVQCPRPGHADLSGAIKYQTGDVRNILERASARETAMRVAIGALCKSLLTVFEIKIISHVVSIGGIEAHTCSLSPGEITELSETSPLRCADRAAEKLMMEEIDNMKEAKDTLGGIFEVITSGVPVGLGSHVQFDRKLDARLAAAVISIQAIKAVEFGMGCEVAKKTGSQVHDEIYYSQEKGFFRQTNRSGGIEGGISTGEDIVLRGYMKPIATLGKPLKSVHIETKEGAEATIERYDICAVPAAGVVAEAVCAFEIANALCEKFGADSLREMKSNFDGYRTLVRDF